MLDCKRSYFSLDDEVKFINGAYMSPMLNEALKIGHEAMALKCQPNHLNKKHFFDHIIELKQLYAQLLHINDWQNVAIVPSVSYGMANAARAIKPNGKKNIVMPAEQFPSNYYIWEAYAKQHNIDIITVGAPDSNNRTADWNERILQAINQDTLLVTISNVHWADGTLFDLAAIRARLDKHGGLLVVDGTQSFGALPFDQQSIRADVLVASSYKWLMGPYSLGFCYYADHLCEGDPIEHSWLNRLNSEDFSGLVNYQPKYKPKAHRYDMGEASNFINVPLAIHGVKQLLEWTPDEIQEYCLDLSRESLSMLQDHGFQLADSDQRAHHLIGIRLQDGINLDSVKRVLDERKFVLSYRGNSIRVSPNVYNKESEMLELAHTMIDAINRNN